MHHGFFGGEARRRRARAARAPIFSSFLGVRGVDGAPSSEDGRRAERVAPAIVAGAHRRRVRLALCTHRCARHRLPRHLTTWLAELLAARLRLVFLLHTDLNKNNRRPRRVSSVRS